MNKISEKMKSNRSITITAVKKPEKKINDDVIMSPTSPSEESSEVNKREPSDEWVITPGFVNANKKNQGNLVSKLTSESEKYRLQSCINCC